MVKTSEKETYVPTLVLKTKELEAAVEAGTVVGQVVIDRTEGTDYGFIDGRELKVDVVTTEAVERAGGVSLFFQGIGGFFGNLWNSVFGFVGGAI